MLWTKNITVHPSPEILNAGNYFSRNTASTTAYTLRGMRNYCMAACSSYLNQSRRLAASYGNRFLISSGQITGLSSTVPPVSSPTPIRRAVHTSVYDKNPDEPVLAHMLPDEVIEPHSDKPWAPHPKTGVFGPATDQYHASAINHAPSEGSVLEQQAFFRPLEDLEKPPPQP